MSGPVTTGDKDAIVRNPYYIATTSYNAYDQKTDASQRMAAESAQKAQEAYENAQAPTIELHNVEPQNVARSNDLLQVIDHSEDYYDWSNLSTAPLSSTEKKLMFFSIVSIAVAIGLIIAFPYTSVILLIIALSVGIASCISTGALFYLMKNTGVKDNEDIDEYLDSPEFYEGGGSSDEEPFPNMFGIWHKNPSGWTPGSCSEDDESGSDTSYSGDEDSLEVRDLVDLDNDISTSDVNDLQSDNDQEMNLQVLSLN